MSENKSLKCRHCSLGERSPHFYHTPKTGDAVVWIELMISGADGMQYDSITMSSVGLLTSMSRTAYGASAFIVYMYRRFRIRQSYVRRHHPLKAQYCCEVITPEYHQLGLSPQTVWTSRHRHLMDRSIAINRCTSYGEHPIHFRLHLARFVIFKKNDRRRTLYTDVDGQDASHAPSHRRPLTDRWTSGPVVRRCVHPMHEVMTSPLNALVCRGLASASDDHRSRHGGANRGCRVFAITCAWNASLKRF